MTYADLFRRTLAARTEEGDKGVKYVRWSGRKFLKLANLTPGHQCRDDVLNEENIQYLRAQAEKTGELSPTAASPWASRMMHYLRTWDEVKVTIDNRSFTEILRDGLKAKKPNIAALGRKAGVDPTNIHAWLSGHNPAEGARNAVAVLDQELGLKGQLVASLGTLKLKRHFTEKYPKGRKAALKKGEGALNELVRFWVKIQAKKHLDPIMKASGLRKAVSKAFAYNTETQGPTSRLRYILEPEDRTAIEYIDKEANAGGILVAAFERELKAQKTTALLSFPYEGWSDRLKSEWERFVDYKLDNTRGLDRTKEGHWTATRYASGKIVCWTQVKTRRQCESLFGWALRSGAVKRPEDLRLAHVIVPEIILGFIRDLSQRNKRTGMNQADASLVGSLRALMYGGGDDKNPGLGYFANDDVGAIYWDDPYFKTRLPLSFEATAVGGYRINIEPVKIPAKNLRGRWQAYLSQATKTLNKFLYSSVKKKGDFADCIKDILSDSEYDIGAWLSTGFARILTHTPGRRSSPIAWARHVRNCVLYMLITTRGFRRETLHRLELSHVQYNSEKQKHFFIIPEELFKQRGKGGSKGGVYAEVDDVLSKLETSKDPLLPAAANALIELYLKEARPLLMPTTESFFLFDSGNGVSQAITLVTRQALGRRVNPHAFRYLIGTWAKRKKLFTEDTAAILCHLPEATQKIYDMTTAQDTGIRTNAAVRKLHNAA